MLGLLGKLDLGSSALLEPASPLLPVNIFMQVTVCKRSRELIELVLESYPVRSALYVSQRCMRFQQMELPGEPSTAAQSCPWVWTVLGMDEGERRAEDALLQH